jgi:ribonuclease E
MRVASETIEGAIAEDGEADEDEGDEQAGTGRGDQLASGERRPRRRGRRGGRRRRGTGPEDGLAGSIADELGPPPALEATSAVADFEGASSEPAPSLVQADAQPEPVSPPAEMQPAADAQPEPVASAPAPTAEETRQEAERAAARRRSTVREKVSFLTSAPAEPAPAVSQNAPEPIAHPAPAPAEPAPASSGEAAPRKAGWWSRRFGSGE